MVCPADCVLPVAQLDKSIGLLSRGSQVRILSGRPRIASIRTFSVVAVAQLVESGIVIPVVAGSSPVSHPTFSSSLTMTSPRRKLVAGNWKMHGGLAANRDLIDALRSALGAFSGADVAVCVPAPYLAQVSSLIQGGGICLGAQNVSEHKSGAYTGEQSAAMLKELGCDYVIVGHSERRALYGETNAQAAAKVIAALDAGLTPIFCMGESLAEREADATEAVIAAQLYAVIAAGCDALAKSVLAYEPVWAIGTGKTASPEQAQAVHAFIRKRIAATSASVAVGIKILYGGSVKAANAQALFACADIDGGLVGGASLQAAEFAAICKAAA